MVSQLGFPLFHGIVFSFLSVSWQVDYPDDLLHICCSLKRVAVSESEPLSSQSPVKTDTALLNLFLLRIVSEMKCKDWSISGDSNMCYCSKCQSCSPSWECNLLPGRAKLSQTRFVIALENVAVLPSTQVPGSHSLLVSQCKSLCECKVNLYFESTNSSNEIKGQQLQPVSSQLLS